jgi:hypothetical protein
MIRTIRTRTIRKSIHTLAAAAFALSFAASTQPLAAQPLAIQATPLQNRITAPIENAHRVTLTGSRSPLADPAADIGAVPSSMKLNGISFIFSRTTAQQQDLDALIAAQQTPGSPLFHQWLNPDQFAARFGVSDADIATVENWLQLQGFSIDSVSRSRNRIYFSGTAALVATAFGAPLHYFKSTSPTGIATTHFAPANDLTVPSALGSVVLAINNLSDFRLHSHIKHAPESAQAAARSQANPNFTSSISGSHFITPGDLATIYDIAPAYSAGFTGANQSIAVVGQSGVLLSDIAAFQSGTGIIAKTPQLVLMPGTGASAIFTGDEGESDLDLEYTSTIAKGAQVFFVYTGNSGNFGVFDALSYAVDERISPILSISYGDCETDFGLTNYGTATTILQQAAAQGQTVIAAAGDSGSTDCYGYSNLTTTQQQAVVADFPATSQYVTGMGGTEFPTADVAIGNNTYFAAQGTNDVISSALSYIPEGVWNDDATFAAEDPSDPIGAGGGGVSSFTARPSWQTGTFAGVAIPAGTFRLTPDISLTASPVNAPLAYCSSDTSGWAQGQVSSCTEGLRDASTGDLTIAGGTSFDAPTFAGMLALIEQSVNSTGEGVINPTLYTLAGSPTTYASAFHDITSGGNQCLSGTAFCSTAGTSDYPAVAGYDEASGLGSIDLYHLLTAWPTTSASALLSTTTSLAAAITTPVVSTNDVITIAVDPTVASSAVPTGTVALVIDGVAATSTTTLTLVNGVATYTFNSAATGAHIINATYSGNATFAPSTATISLTVGATQVGSFTLAAGGITVTSGSSGTSNVTVTPAGSYSGTVAFTIGIGAVSAGADASLADTCYSINNNTNALAVSGSAPVTTTMTIYTSLSECAIAASNGVAKRRFKTVGHASNQIPPHHPSRSIPIAATLAGLFALGLLRKRSRRLPALLAVAIFFAIAGFGLSGCSNNTAVASTGGGTTTPTGNETPGTYNLTLTATDDTTNQTAAANFVLQIN